MNTIKMVDSSGYTCFDNSLKLVYYNNTHEFRRTGKKIRNGYCTNITRDYIPISQIQF